MSVAGDPTVEHGVDFELELDDIDPKLTIHDHTSKQGNAGTNGAHYARYRIPAIRTATVSHRSSNSTAPGTARLNHPGRGTVPFTPRSRNNLPAGATSTTASTGPTTIRPNTDVTSRTSAGGDSDGRDTGIEPATLVGVNKPPAVHITLQAVLLALWLCFPVRSRHRSKEKVMPSVENIWHQHRPDGVRTAANPGL
jgi:hypothetical protein